MCIDTALTTIPEKPEGNFTGQPRFHRWKKDENTFWIRNKGWKKRKKRKKKEKNEKNNEKNSRFLPFFGIWESWLKIDHFSLHKSSGKPLHVREPSNGKPLEASPYKYLCKGNFGKPFPTRMPASETLGPPETPKWKFWETSPYKSFQHGNFGKPVPTKPQNGNLWKLSLCKAEALYCTRKYRAAQHTT